MLAVHRRRLTVRIAQVVVAVQHLDFEHAGQKDAAVAAFLAVAGDLLAAWRTPRGAACR